MSWHTYLLFVGASFLLSISPGPDMIYLLSRCVAQGPRAGVAASLGINLGCYVHLLAAITGLSAILMTSALAFTIVKWAGAAYLIYLGISALLDRSNVQLTSSKLRGRSTRAIFLQGFISDVLNPKVAVFFLALLPQFVDQQAGNVIGQLLILGLTVNCIGLAVNLAMVALSGRISAKLREDELMAARLRKLMGVMFIGLGAKLAAERA
ncbi:lysine transporter LysE [Terrihabitans soli]|uniref:Lysine transporter LysE n=1 Tax=Terrihabitans soli TaxID=708113 RepID=A0A6S6QQH6_9HYPH|nr:LysE family translocator [Terrihabitans soli]BCJ90217.1 lysine transporter LysE [Terrihabitans soli]